MSSIRAWLHVLPNNIKLCIILKYGNVQNVNVAGVKIFKNIQKASYSDEICRSQTK